MQSDVEAIQQEIRGGQKAVRDHVTSLNQLWKNLEDDSFFSVTQTQNPKLRVTPESPGLVGLREVVYELLYK